MIYSIQNSLNTPIKVFTNISFFQSDNADTCFTHKFIALLFVFRKISVPVIPVTFNRYFVLLKKDVNMIASDGVFRNKCNVKTIKSVLYGFFNCIWLNSVMAITSNRTKNLLFRWVVSKGLSASSANSMYLCVLTNIRTFNRTILRYIFTCAAFLRGFYSANGAFKFMRPALPLPLSRSAKTIFSTTKNGTKTYVSIVVLVYSIFLTAIKADSDFGWSFSRVINFHLIRGCTRTRTTFSGFFSVLMYLKRFATILTDLINFWLAKRMYIHSLS